MNGVVREVWETAKESVKHWSDDNASRLAAALAFYAILSLAPLLVIAIAVIGFFYGADAARGRVSEELGSFVGSGAAAGIESIVASARSPETGLVSTVVGVVTLFFGASVLFGELQASLNTVWEVRRRPGRGILGEAKVRFFSFTMVLGVAFLLLISLVVSASLSAIGSAFAWLLPGGELVWQVFNFVFSLAVVSALFAVIFKYIPDADVRWRDVWMGGIVTAVLFSIGKSLLGLYLGKAAVVSAYGAAGSVIALVVWVYYASQIFLFGAELTQVKARRSGREIRPSRGAVAFKRQLLAPSDEPLATRDAKVAVSGKG